MQLLYVMDPMCAWCYAFQPELDDFIEKHSSAKVDWIMGGLAPDNNQPMAEELKQTISSYWHQIEEKSRVTFNHDYWKMNTPYRSTYPACRAVIAAEKLKAKSSGQMAKAIQSAYYQQAKNPSLENTLVDCAGVIGIDGSEFSDLLNSEDTQLEFQQHLGITQQLQVRGFPALFYIDDKNQAYPIALGFTQAENLEQQFDYIREQIG